MEHIPSDEGRVGVALRCGHAVAFTGSRPGEEVELPRARPCAAPAYYVGNPRTIITRARERGGPSTPAYSVKLEVALILGSDLEVDADETTCTKAVQDHGGFVLINDFSVSTSRPTR